MKVCVVGLGYIGLPTAALVAKAGHEVLGFDVDATLIERLQRGVVPIVNEDGLEDIVLEVLSSGSLKVATEPEVADVYLIAVPTPFQSNYTSPSGLDYPVADLSYVEAAARSVAPYLRPGSLVILESTVPPGTTRGLLTEAISGKGVDTAKILIAHAPERVLPGNIVFELMHNSRIVGGVTEEATSAACDFYRTFVKGPVVATDATTAELVKLMENTYRDVNIALANEFARVSEYLGVNVWQAIQLANLHPRVNILRPGPGVGGHCIGVDPYFLIQAAPSLTPLVQTARRVNESMPGYTVQLVEQLLAGRNAAKLAILGASYKANVGDVRESPALEVARLLRDKGFVVAVHDPYVEEYNMPVDEVVRGAAAVLLLTDHRVYNELDPVRLRDLMSAPLLLDARGAVDPLRWRAAGFTVRQLGVPEAALKVVSYD